MANVDPFDFLAGLGLFLLGMWFLEQALAELAGRAFRLFLRRHTDHPLQSVMSGTLATALLQSSSVVSLMVLAFAAAGVIALENAVGVVLGANLGTTFTGWIVATIGFKLDLAALAMPAIAVGGIGLVALGDYRRASGHARLAIGIGLLLLGLEFMKSSVVALADDFDLSRFADYPPIAFFVIGMVFTAVIQSSSAMMMITLSALHAGIIELPAAAATVIGADLGTTGTVLLGSIGGPSVKKRIALAHFLFNLTVDVAAFLALVPLVAAVRWVIGDEPLIALVLFHSTFNLLGIIAFLPFLVPFGRFLERRFSNDEPSIARYIDKPASRVPEAAIAALEHEAKHLLALVVVHNLRSFELDSPAPPDDGELLEVARSVEPEELYRRIKILEGEILAFSASAEAQRFEPEESARLQHLLAAVRNAVHSAKSLKDVRDDLRDFSGSLEPALEQAYTEFRNATAALYQWLVPLLSSKRQQLAFESLVELAAYNRSGHTRLHAAILAESGRRLAGIAPSTVFNVNRELYSSNSALVLALADLLLDPARADEFASLPGIG